MTHPSSLEVSRVGWRIKTRCVDFACALTSVWRNIVETMMKPVVVPPVFDSHHHHGLLSHSCQWVKVIWAALVRLRRSGNMVSKDPTWQWLAVAISQHHHHLLLLLLYPSLTSPINNTISSKHSTPYSLSYIRSCIPRKYADLFTFGKTLVPAQIIHI